MNQALVVFLLTLLSLAWSWHAEAQSEKPIDARLPTASTTLKRLGADPILLRTPANLLKEQQAGAFVVAKTPPAVEFALLPMQEPIPGNDTWLFSCWGDIEFGGDDNFYVAMGDHQALPGHSWIFRVDPKSQKVDTVVAVNKVLGQVHAATLLLSKFDKNKDKQLSKEEVPAELWKEIVRLDRNGDGVLEIAELQVYRPGKIHAPLISIGAYLYFIPYRGSIRYCDTPYRFAGEHLMRYHYKTGLTEDLGIPIPNCSVAQMNYHAPSQRLYMVGAWCPAQKDPKVSRFAVYDVPEQKVVYMSDVDNQPYASLRSILVAPDGRAWYMTGRIETDKRGRVADLPTGKYAVYDPKTNQAKVTSLSPPAGLDGSPGRIRAASAPDPSGIIWCITHEWGGKTHPSLGAIFPFDTRTASFGKNLGHCFAHGTSTTPVSLYTAMAKLDSSGTKLYYIPSAHGGASRHGAALIQFDTKTHTRKVLAFLYDHVKHKAGYALGGTYGLALSKDGSMVCVNWMDERDRGQKETARRSAVTIVHIPESER